MSYVRHCRGDTPKARVKIEIELDPESKNQFKAACSTRGTTMVDRLRNHIQRDINAAKSRAS